MSEIYVQLVVGFPRDPKVRALAGYGPDGNLARDLYVQMLLFCKESLTDGFVPDVQVGALVYPISPTHGGQLAKQLASVGLINPVNKDGAEGWQIAAWHKRNKSRAEVERLSAIRAASGRKGGSRSPGTGGTEAPANQLAKQVAYQVAEPPAPHSYRVTEKTPPPLPPATTGPESPAGAQAEGEGDGLRPTDKPTAADIAALAAEMHAIRDDWPTAKIARVLSDPGITERNWQIVVIAALIVANDDRSDFPNRLLQDGYWWPQAARQVRAARPAQLPGCGECDGPPTYRRYKEPDPDDPYGNRAPYRCPDCHPALAGNGRPVEPPARTAMPPSTAASGPVPLGALLPAIAKEAS